MTDPEAWPHALAADTLPMLLDSNRELVAAEAEGPVSRYTSRGMPGSLAAGSRRRRSALVLALGVYAILISAAPALHHDFACHLKSSTHCTACTASPLASRLGAGVVGVAAVLPAADAVADLPPATTSDASPFRIPGRSPPA